MTGNVFAFLSEWAVISQLRWYRRYMSVLKWAGIFCFIQKDAERGGKDMKKMAVLLSTALCASLCGCGGSDGSSYKVAIVKQMTHSSLDEITDAICAELDRISAEEGISIEYGEVYDGQNDQAQLTTISSQIAATRPDVIIPVISIECVVNVIFHHIVHSEIGESIAFRI